MSWGVSPTPAKKNVPKTKKIEPTIANIKVIKSSLNNWGIKKKATPIKEKDIIDKLKKNEDTKFSSPEWALYPPKSLKKLWVIE